MTKMLNKQLNCKHEIYKMNVLCILVTVWSITKSTAAFQVSIVLL